METVKTGALSALKTATAKNAKGGKKNKLRGRGRERGQEHLSKREIGRERGREQMKVQLIAEKDSNNILGGFWRVKAYGLEGGSEQYLGEQLYAGYTKRDAINRARQLINNKGRLN